MIDHVVDHQKIVKKYTDPHTKIVKNNIWILNVFHG